MPDIRQLKLPNNTTYDLRDSRVDSIISQGTRWVGVTTTPLSDGSATSTIVINGDSHNAEIGDITSYNDMEFIWNGTVWQEFGSTGSLKALAFKDSVAVSTVVPATFATTFTGKSATISVSGTTNGSVSAPAISLKTAGSTDTVTGITGVGTLPSATMPTFTVANDILTITAGSFSAGTLPTADTEKTFKTTDAAYESSTPAFTGASMTSTGTYTPEATSISTTTVTSTSVAGTVTYTP